MFKQVGRKKGTRNVYLEEDLQRRIFLGKKLKRRRRQIKLTQTDVADAINVTFHEKGVNSISTFRLEPLRLALKIPESKIGFLINKYNRKQYKTNEEKKEKYANNPSISFEMQDGELVVKGNPFNEDKK